MSEPARREPALTPRLLETAHVAHRLNCSTEFVRLLIRRHLLPAIRLGTHYRIEQSAVQAYIEKRRTIQFIRSTLSEGGRA